MGLDVLLRVMLWARNYVDRIYAWKPSQELINGGFHIILSLLKNLLIFNSVRLCGRMTNTTVVALGDVVFFRPFRWLSNWPNMPILFFRMFNIGSILWKPHWVGTWLPITPNLIMAIWLFGGFSRIYMVMWLLEAFNVFLKNKWHLEALNSCRNLSVAFGSFQWFQKDFSGHKKQFYLR